MTRRFGRTAYQPVAAARRMSRRGLFAGAFAIYALAPGLAAAQAAAGGFRDLGAEAFVQSQAQRVISTLADNRMAEAEKQKVFRALVDEVADVPRITLFVLGRYARTLSPDQEKAFAAAFRTYAEAVYRDRLSDYHGERLKVTGSLVRRAGDVVVNTEVSGGRMSRPMMVAWRVQSAQGRWRVVDVQVKGVWLAITQQQDFVSTLDNAHGDIEVLIAQLRRAPAGQGHHTGGSR